MNLAGISRITVHPGADKQTENLRARIFNTRTRFTANVYVGKGENQVVVYILSSGDGGGELPGNPRTTRSTAHSNGSHILMLGSSYTPRRVLLVKRLHRENVNLARFAVSNKDEQHVDGIADIVVHLTF